MTINKNKKRLSTYEKRKEILDNPYTKGVTSVDGKSVGIRAMTQEEIDFLNQFNEEFGKANISEENTGLHTNLILANKVKVKELKNELKNLKKQLKDIKYDKSGPPLLEHRKTELKKLLQIAINDIKDKIMELDVIKSIRHDNYARGCDPMNYKKYHTNFLDMKTNTHGVTFNSASESEYIELLESNEIIIKI